MTYIGQWTFIGAHTRTGETLADLPISPSSMSTKLRGWGEMQSVTLPLGGLDEKRRRELLDATRPGRCSVYALLDGELRWGGWIKNRNGGDDPTLTVMAFGGYFDGCRLRSNLAFAQVDQLEIARQLIAAHQSLGPGFNVRAVVDAQNSGVKRDRTYLAGDNLMIGELLTQLCNVEGGFDYAWGVEYDTSVSPAVPRPRLRLGYPRLGATTPSLDIETGSDDVTDWTQDESAPVTDVWAVGDVPQGSTSRPVVNARLQSLIDAGDVVVDYIDTASNVTSTSVLQLHANAAVKAYGGVTRGLSLSVPEQLFVESGADIGDDARVSLRGARFPDPFDGVWRVTEYSWQPGSGKVGLTIAPRIEIGGRLPTSDDLAGILGSLLRDVRTLQTSNE